MLIFNCFVQKTPTVSFVNFPLNAETRFLIASVEIAEETIFSKDL